MKEHVRVVILAAGLGTRMKSSIAKVLHQAAGDTILNHVLRAALAVAAPENITVVVGHQAEQVRKSVRFTGIQFAEQKEQKGTAHAVVCARDQAASDEGLLLILNGDGPLLKAETLKRLLQSAGDAKTGGTLVTTVVQDASGYGRIIRSQDGMIAAIREQKAASPEELQIREINPGVYCFRAQPFWKYIEEVRPDNPAREYYLTDMVEILRAHGFAIAPLLVEDETELLGINTRVELAVADRILRARKAEELMLSGVTIEAPESVRIDAEVEIGPDTVLEPGVQLRGKTRIGERCHVGTGAILRDCQIESDVTVYPYVIAEGAVIRSQAAIGPFARVRIRADIGRDARIGNFVELKNTDFGAGSKAQHLAYLGDSSIGADANIGAGTITCNYDGQHKNRTEIADEVFVGSNSTLVAPLKIAEGAYIAAGSVITKPVEADALAIGRAYQVDKPGWARRRREKVSAPAK
ncbi:MAG TPA: bifunctional UDP-N-acetylglucosamine diphosphorylase/glucosamine-1-phosphate N-acetyltransferase GlmU [Bryobacteraceae bacterium]|jgi:bifunctional UDP-N-acetylglucosamine pyrophosphorylase/glucosamine-1-phosphate N-acetyltransferase|nr:bifunctional UDP-N-acetylglucosamine diphosphorylase/glucosamine-1-phosphate N-acetyltransferase GlmU [Bryobacteraceae bacterium]